MAARQELWEAIQNSFNTLIQRIQPELQEVIPNTPFGQVQGGFQFGLAFYIEPEPLTVERMAVRNPYSNPSLFADIIQNLKDAKMLDENGVAQADAIQAYTDLVDKQNDILGGIEGLQDFAEQFNRSAELINRVKAAAFHVDGLDVPCLTDLTRKSQPDGVPHSMFYAAYRLPIFRDDCHLAAWKHLDVDGMTFEMFSMVWSGDATSAEKMMEVRPNRGYTREDYQAALERLVAKGWLETTAEEGHYQTTDSGKKVRDDVEQKTDAFFYAAFDALSNDEVQELTGLLTEISDAFAPVPAE